MRRSGCWRRRCELTRCPPTVHDHLGFMKLVAGRFDEAIDHFTRAHALDPNLAFLDQYLVRALTFAGRFSEALSFWETKMDPITGKVNSKDSPGWQPWIAAAYVMSGRRAEVEQWAAVHDEPYRLALIHSALGNRDRTFEAAEQGSRDRPAPRRAATVVSRDEISSGRSRDLRRFARSSACLS